MSSFERGIWTVVWIVGGALCVSTTILNGIGSAWGWAALSGVATFICGVLLGHVLWAHHDR